MLACSSSCHHKLVMPSGTPTYTGCLRTRPTNCIFIKATNVVLTPGNHKLSNWILTMIWPWFNFCRQIYFIHPNVQNSYFRNSMFLLLYLWIVFPMHMCSMCDHTHAHKDPQSRQSVRISISFNVTRPICFQKCCHTETSPLQNRARGLGADSWDPGSLHGLFVQQNLLFCHSRPVTSEII